MRDSWLALLLVARFCLAARDLGFARRQHNPDAPEDSNPVPGKPRHEMCGGALQHIDLFEGDAVYTASYDKIIEGIQTFLSMQEEQMERKRSSLESAATALQDTVTSATVTVTNKQPVDERVVGEMLGPVCDKIFNMGQQGVENCKAAKCGLQMNDDDDDEAGPGYLERFKQEFEANKGQFKQYDKSPFLATCNEVLMSEKKRQKQAAGSAREAGTAGMKTSWCPDLCDDLYTVLCIQSQSLHIEATRAKSIEIQVRTEAVNEQQTLIGAAQKEIDECKKQMEMLTVFKTHMDELRKQRESSINDVSNLQHKILKLSRMIKVRKAKVGKHEEALNRANSELEKKKLIKEELKLKVEQQIRLERECTEKVQKQLTLVELSEEDIVKLKEVFEKLTLFKAFLGQAFLKMSQLWDKTLIQPLKSILGETMDLESILVKAEYVKSEATSEDSMIVDIGNMLEKLVADCDTQWYDDLAPIKLQDYRLVLPSGPNPGNTTEDLPESVEDLRFPEGFLKPELGQPQGLADLCLSPEIRAFATTKEQVLKTIEAERKEMILALTQILSVSTDAFEMQHSISMNSLQNVHDCQGEPEGLRKFAVMYAETAFYKSYALEWGHQRSGKLGYFLQLERQIAHLTVVAERLLTEKKTQLETLETEVFTMQTATEALTTELNGYREEYKTHKGNTRHSEEELVDLITQFQDSDEELKKLREDLKETRKTVESLETSMQERKSETGSFNSQSLLHMAMKTQQHMEDTSTVSVNEHKEAEIWRRKVVELRAEIENIKRNALFLPPFASSDTQ